MPCSARRLLPNRSGGRHPRARARIPQKRSQQTNATSQLGRGGCLRRFSPDDLVEGGRVPRVPELDYLAVGKVTENHLTKIDRLAGRRPRPRVPPVVDPPMRGGKVSTW